MTLNVRKWPLLSAVIPRLALTALNFCQPFLLHRAIDLSQQPVSEQSTNDGYGLIAAYFFVYLGIAVCSIRHCRITTLTFLKITTGQFQHLTYRVITMVRGGLISMLYSKTMDLSVHAVDPSSSMILMSADIERITNGWQTIHELWANVIEVGLAIYLLEQQLGAACAVPIAVAIGETYKLNLITSFNLSNVFSLDGGLLGGDQSCHVSSSHVARGHRKTNISHNCYAQCNERSEDVRSYRRFV
jgi:ATP-binding cassette subfamily C (CFTR/MRP) protein 1